MVGFSELFIYYYLVGLVPLVSTKKISTNGEERYGVVFTKHTFNTLLEKIEILTHENIENIPVIERNLMIKWKADTTSENK